MNRFTAMSTEVTSLGSAPDNFGINYGMGGIVSYYPTNAGFHYPSPNLPAGVDLFGAVLLVRCGRRKRMIQRTVCEQSLSGGLCEKNLVIAEKMVYLVPFLERDEEDFSLTCAPVLH